MGRMRHRYFCALAHGCGCNDDVLKPAQLFDDRKPHDDAGNETTEVAHNGQEHHEPGNGRSSFKGSIALRLAGGAPVFSREELDRPRDDLLAGEARLFGDNGIGHSWFLSGVLFDSG